MDAVETIAQQRARANSASWRFRGQVIAAVERKETSKSAAAAAAGITRPTLDAWIKVGPLLPDWEASPTSVTVDGITIRISWDQTLTTTAAYNASAEDVHRHCIVLTRGDGVLINAEDLGDALVTYATTVGGRRPITVGLFNPDGLDEWTTRLISDGIADRDERNRRAELRERGLAELTELAGGLREFAGTGGKAVEARQRVERRARALHETGVLTRAEVVEIYPPIATYLTER